MGGGSSSSRAAVWIRFAAIYDTLPPDVQAAIVQKQLIPLLDLASKSKCKRVLASAAKMKRRHAGIPVINLKAKQREVNALLDDLHRDAKRSFVKERSHRTELIEQTVESVTCWLNDLWRIVYEHNVDFMMVHQCLLFIVNALDQVAHGRASARACGAVPIRGSSPTNNEGGLTQIGFEATHLPHKASNVPFVGPFNVGP
ncbi:hypothetical protein C8Q78DRAFT_995087 [Trametes maxima]|nr:hypothetical protein C8Q78DRAFT_995087 [Trametes maxima]